MREKAHNRLIKCTGNWPYTRKVADNTGDQQLSKSCSCARSLNIRRRHISAGVTGGKERAELVLKPALKELAAGSVPFIRQTRELCT